MAEWIYFVHAPRENFADTMTDEEEAVWSAHFERLKRLLAEGVLVMAGPTLGSTNTGRMGACRTARISGIASSRAYLTLASTTEIADLRN